MRGFEAGRQQTGGQPLAPSDTLTSWPQARGVALAVLTRAMITGDLAARLTAPTTTDDSRDTGRLVLRAHRDVMRRADAILTRVERSLPSVNPRAVAAEAPVVLAARSALDAVTDVVRAALAPPAI